MLLLIVLSFAYLCSCTDLTGSELHTFHMENYHNAEEHKPLLPYMINPHYMRINLPHVLPQKGTVTVTKTIVLETTKHVHSHQVCVKAYPGTPPCHPNAKIQATPVFKTPIHEATNVIGFLEKNGEVELPHQVNERRHLLPWNHFGHAIGAAKDLFRKTHTITETLWVTRVEQYVDNMVTATLIAENCIPISDDIPQCPMRVEHYVHHSKSGPEHIPIFEKEFPQNRMDMNEEKDKKFPPETSETEP